jgi:hypothetical protein
MSDPALAMQADWHRTAIVVGLAGSIERGVRVMAGSWVVEGLPSDAHTVAHP